jgi:ppGpp synthetase/RelA/SpoT-type nucleotidyltranferase
MMTLEEAQARFDQDWERYKNVAEDTATIIRQAAAERHLTCIVEPRAKAVSSFVKKAITKQYLDPWAEITDKAGVRVIVPHSGRLDDARDLVLESFEVIQKEDSREDEELGNRLEYPRLHMQVYAPSSSVEDGPDRLDCEVQIRSEAADLWARMSHTLLYKPITQAPRPIKRSLYRLLAIVELFDEEVARAVEAIEKSPEYEPDVLLAEAERIYYTFAWSNYSRDLSRLICPILAGVIGSNIADFTARLPEFSDTHQAHLRKVYRQYGASSEFASHGKYILAGQPESIVIFELFECQRHALRQAWEEADLPDSLLDDLADVWGVDA